MFMTIIRLSGSDYHIWDDSCSHILTNSQLDPGVCWVTFNSIKGIGLTLHRAVYRINVAFSSLRILI